MMPTMSPKNFDPVGDSPLSTVMTTFLISNLHCPTCVGTIESALASLHPKPFYVSTSVLSHSVRVSHDASLRASAVRRALEDAAFEVYSVARTCSLTDADLEKGKQYDDNAGYDARPKLWRRGWTQIWRSEADRNRQRHISQCGQCQSSRAQGRYRTWQSSLPSTVPYNMDKNNFRKKILANRGATDGPSRELSAPKNTPLVVVDSAAKSRGIFRASLSLGGMTCGSCVGSVSTALTCREWIRSLDVSLLTNSATVLFEGQEHLAEVIETIQDSGYDVEVEQLDKVRGGEKQSPSPTTSIWRASFSIDGMTCSSCAGTITSAVEQYDWAKSVEVNLITNSAVVLFRNKENLERIKQAIEDVGYEARLDDVVPVGEAKAQNIERNVAIQIDGMHCNHCPQRILEMLMGSFGQQVHVGKRPSLSDPILSINYIPRLPDLTIRHIIASICAADAAFEPRILHPPSLEERSRSMLAREQRRILIRLIFSITVAIPTFIIGLVLMTLVDSDNAGRQYISETVWAGNVSRGQWALFIMATPVYFFAADVFHVRMFKELRALWRPRSTTPILQRLYRFGTMNMLISLGTSIAYFSSVAELAIAATEPSDMAPTSMTSSYFDSVVFLTMFLLIGRFLEAYSKSRTGDAVTLLGKLKPTEAILVESAEQMQLSEQLSQYASPTTRKIPLDLLEVGDTVKVLHGAAPPSDGIIVSGETQFDEASLTGESRLVAKHLGDEVYAGTVNKASPVSIRITNIVGASLLDQIIQVVREGQARRAPVERVADVITGHFVPLVVLLGVSSWIIWLALGLSGALPASYRDTDVGGWPFWSLQFSIAVFVIACPCGIGLAAPTALFVGGGLAAQHGILARGGGEAFQEASKLDCIVFDKTGTLTEGGKLSVTDYVYIPLMHTKETRSLGIIKRLEENSSHPVANALVSFCDTKALERINITSITEIPGKGIRGMFWPDSSDDHHLEAILGNEAFMLDYGVEIDENTGATLDMWKSKGKSVALFAIKATSETIPQSGIDTDIAAAAWSLSAVFATSDKLRPDAAGVVRKLKSRGVDVWMISGDNPVTAKIIGNMVGISDDKVIAGVHPDQKAKKIQWLQKALERKSKHGSRRRATVAMVGDGINDAPALTMADVGIAIGSGSDVAISSADFVLMSSSLTSLLVLIDLSRTVLRRVWFNFGWALIYNLIALPIAAGVLYPLSNNGSHIKLDPVWASLAMALSSVSVVCSSLLLRSRLPGIGFRAPKFSKFLRET